VSVKPKFKLSSNVYVNQGTRLKREKDTVALKTRVSFIALTSENFSSRRMRAAQHAVRRIHGLSRAVVVHQWRRRTGLNLITSGHGFVESYPNRDSDIALKFLPHCSRFLSTSTMSSLDSITASLASLSITPSAPVLHAETNSPTSWREALLATPSAPESFELIKTLVYKPKTAKTATPVPVVVIARDETETSSSALGKKLNLKELRLASEDLLAEFFSLDKNSSVSFSFVLWY
jgi:prolyl-tRNA synthetase